MRTSDAQHNLMCTLVACAKPAQASKLVYQWAATGLLTQDEFTELIEYIPLECGCEVCGGTRGGCPGNENVVDGTIICDYCYADGVRK